VSGAAASGSARFSDHFSRDSSSYAKFRPRYPVALFEWVAGLVPSHRLAWDCATGNGQAATQLARSFDRVVASDRSRGQLLAATRVPGVHYLAALGEWSALAPGRVNLVTVAQAYHWLDHPRFFAEVDRIIAPGGFLAVWFYGSLRATPAIDAALAVFYEGTVGPYWPPERVHVDTGYRLLPLPIDEVSAPAFAIEADLTLAQLLGYIRSWSAVGRFVAARGYDPVDGFGAELVPIWGNPDSTRRIVWPLTIRAGRWLGATAAGAR
jgi:SAM-dependent methyltransferase